MDGTWSETGDRYMLKLFRDYVFHQVTEDGRPWVDMAHVVQCLNKLDAGAPEKVNCPLNYNNAFQFVFQYFLLGMFNVQRRTKYFGCELYRT